MAHYKRDDNKCECVRVEYKVGGVSCCDCYRCIVLDCGRNGRIYIQITFAACTYCVLGDGIVHAADGDDSSLCDCLRRRRKFISRSAKGDFESLYPVPIRVPDSFVPCPGQ